MADEKQEIEDKAHEGRVETAEGDAMSAAGHDKQAEAAHEKETVSKEEAGEEE